MIVRRMDILDLQPVLELYTHALTHLQPGEVHYPQLGPDGVREVAAMLAHQVTQDPQWFAMVAVDIDGVLVGVMSARLLYRPLGVPKRVLSGDNIVVHAACRHQGLGMALARAVLSEGWDRGAEVVELSWTPGSLGADLWPAQGLVPYRVTAAWLNPDGTPRTGLP